MTLIFSAEARLASKTTNNDTRASARLRAGLSILSKTFSLTRGCLVIRFLVAVDCGFAYGASTTQRNPMVPARSCPGDIKRYFWCSSRRYVCGKYQSDPAG